MFRGSLGVPESNPRRRGGFAACLGLLLVACATLVLGLVLYGLYGSSQPRATLPIVVITDPKPGDSVGANDTVVVFAHAQDPDRIARAELLVNGQLVATQGSREPQGANPLVFNQAWRPTLAGAYSVMVRAYDLVGYVGQSETVILQVLERTFQPNPNAVEQVVDDSGNSSLVPHLPDQQKPSDAPPGAQTFDAPPGGGDVPNAPAGDGDVPNIEPPGVEQPLPWEVPPQLGEPIGPSLWEGLDRLFPGGRDARCRMFGIWFCPDVPPAGLRPPGAPNNIAADNQNCDVEVRWSYSADDVVGFYVLRAPAGVFLPLPRLVEIVQARQSGNDRKWYSYRLRENTGRYRYTVAAFNSAGETLGALSDVVELGAPCNAPNANVSVEFELLEIEVGQSYDTVYCYASVGGSPFEQVREITRQGESQKRIRVQVPGNTAWQVAARCLAWRGEELIFLGDVQRSHQCPCVENQRYTLAPANGSFQVTYRIGPSVVVAPQSGQVQGSPIAMLEITLRELRAHGLCDDDCDAKTVQAYGMIGAFMKSPSGDVRDAVYFDWNAHTGCDDFGFADLFPCRMTRIRENNTYSWAGTHLSPHGTTEWHWDNNRFSLPVRSAQDSLWITFSFKDHDDWSGDDSWCWAGTELLSSRAVSNWSRLDVTFGGNNSVGVDGRAEHGSCTVTLNVKGSPP